MQNLLRTLTNNVKNHPLIAFVISIIPIFGISFGISRLYFDKVLAEYSQKVSFQQIEILRFTQSLNQLQQELQNQRSNTHSKSADNHNSESTKPDIKSSIPETESVKVILKKESNTNLFDADLKIALRSNYNTLKNVTFDAVINGKSYYIDLRWDEIEEVIQSGYQYKFNLLDQTDTTAEIMVTRVRI